MNIIQRWAERRRNRRESAAITKKQLEEAREAAKQQLVEKLRQRTKDISDEMEKLGFKTPTRFSHDNATTTSTMVVIGPDSKVYELTVYKSGGYKLTAIT